jgi:formate-dependent nitrite reductase membrane component NrfD
MLTWKYEIAIYLWIAGIAGGAYFAAFLIDRLSGGRHKLLMKTAMLIAVPLVALGSLLLVIDLGAPLRFWHLFVTFRPESAMSVGAWILIGYAITGTLMLLLWAVQWLKPSEQMARLVGRVNEILSWITFGLSVLVITYTGVLLSSTNQPLWATTFLVPAAFVASAIATGTGVIFLVARTGLDRFVDRLFAGTGEGTSERVTHLMAMAAAIVGVIEVLVLMAYLGWQTSFSTPAAAQALGILISGPLRFLFWGGVVLAGLLIPMVLELASMSAERKEAISNVSALAVSSSLVLLGGLILRVVMVLGGQMVW